MHLLCFVQVLPSSNSPAKFMFMFSVEFWLDDSTVVKGGVIHSSTSWGLKVPLMYELSLNSERK